MIIDLGPHPNPISEERIREMINCTPRRMKLSSEWKKPLYEPNKGFDKWTLVLPFPETFENAFLSMCSDTNPHIYPAKDNRCCIFLNSSDKDDGLSVNRAKEWIQTVGKYVAIRDCLAISFALDYRTEGAKPTGSRTKVGELCRTAKLYDGSKSPDMESAKELSKMCVKAVGELTCYKIADCIVAVPPSNPAKVFDLPKFLAKEICGASGKEDLTDKVKTIAKRTQLKTVRAGDKLDAIRGSINVDESAFRDRIVLIIDDLYQSGITVNYLGMLLLQAGARKVLGLACEKTLTNDDNVG